MKFGMFYEWPNPSLGSWKRLFEESLEHEKIMRSIRLTGEHVIPALRDVRPSSRLMEELAASGPAGGRTTLTDAPPT